MSPYESCSHGYVPGSCAECRAERAVVDGVVSPSRSADEIAARQAEITAELQRMDADPGAREDTHGELRDRLVAELDALRTERRVLARSESIARATAVMANPANVESGHSQPPGAPALVKGLGDGRRETADEVIARSGNPWRGADGGPLAGRTTYGLAESSAGVISRAHTALEALEDTLTRDGCQKLAEAFADSYGWPGVTVQRTRDEQAEAAELFLALSNPHYAEAFRSVLRYPGEFISGGTGFESMSDEQRSAWRDVRTNELCRSAFAEAAGSTGAFALPLQLDPHIILTNAGSANPFRKKCRNVVGTSNTWNGVTSAGSTANWLPEGTAVTDTTPTLGQLVITPYKESVWIFGSFEVMDDTILDQQIPALIADAKDRLEVVAFATGSGSGQPFGVITHGTSDATTGAVSAAIVYALHQSLPPRFRVGDNAMPFWLANVAIINALRQVPKFTGALQSIVDDTAADNIPEMLGLDILETSSMDAVNSGTGHKNLAIMDGNSYVIVNRQPEILLFEPLVKSQATALPTGQRGWFSYSRTGADITTATACQYHTT